MWVHICCCIVFLSELVAVRIDSASGVIINFFLSKGYMLKKSWKLGFLCHYHKKRILMLLFHAIFTINIVNTKKSPLIWFLMILPILMGLNFEMPIKGTENKYDFSLPPSPKKYVYIFVVALIFCLNKNIFTFWNTYQFFCRKNLNTSFSSLFSQIILSPKDSLL